MTSDTKTATARSRVPWRAIAVGCALLPVNALWLVQMEMAAPGGAHGTTDVGPYPSTLSLYGNAVCFLVALSGLNALLRRWREQWALSRDDRSLRRSYSR